MFLFQHGTGEDFILNEKTSLGSKENGAQSPQSKRQKPGSGCLSAKSVSSVIPQMLLIDMTYSCSIHYGLLIFVVTFRLQLTAIQQMNYPMAGKKKVDKMIVEQGNTWYFSFFLSPPLLLLSIIYVCVCIYRIL